MPIMKFNKKAVSLAVAAAITSSITVAQDIESDGETMVLEELIVTARLIDESIQDIPISVAAFSEDTIEKRGLDGLIEIARATANFSFENYNGAFNTPVIRAQSQNRLTNPVQNVATFYNGVYLPRGYMIDASLLNIGQVEILRGPQAAAFGRNAFAGAVNFKSKDIGDTTTADITLGLGENDYEQIDFTAQLPLAESFGVIVGYSGGEFDGGFENSHALADAGGPEAKTVGNLGGYDYDSYNVGFTLSPTDSFKLKANYLKSERDVENVPQFVISSSTLGAFDTNNCAPAGFFNRNQLFCGALPTEAPLAAGDTRKPGFVVDPRSGLSIESEVLSLEAELQLSESLSLNLNYGDATGSLAGANSSARNQEVGNDSPFLPAFLSGLNIIDTSGEGTVETDSIEARLTWDASDALTAYVGIYTSDTVDSQKNNLLAAQAQTSGPLTPAFAVNLGPGSVNDALNTRDLTSGFFFVNYKSDSWAFSGEGRYTKEDVTDTNNLANTSATQDYNYFTPRVTATYFMSDNRNLYASYARGAKAGGFNVGGSNPAGFVNGEGTFDEETNDTIEFGSRNVLADGALTLNATVFYIDSENLQVNQPSSLNPNVSVIGNRANASTVGLELEAFYNASENLELYGGLGYAKAEYGDGVIDTSLDRNCDDIVCSSDIGGNRLERTPELTLNLGFDYGNSLTDNTDYFLRGDISYQDEQFLNPSNITTIESRTIANAAVGITSGNFEVKLAVDNLFDEVYANSAFEVGFLQTTVVNLGSARRAVLSVSYSY